MILNNFGGLDACSLVQELKIWVLSLFQVYIFVNDWINGLFDNIFL